MRALGLTLLALGACGADRAIMTGAGGGAPCPPPSYPTGPYGTTAGAVISDQTWAGVSAAGSSGTIALHDLQATCPGDPPVAILRIGAVWCGTCRSYAGHTKTLLGSDVGGNVR